MSYLQDLETNLKALPKDEREEAMVYYSEYLADGGLSDGAAVAEFGTPKNLARRLVADYYMDEEREVPEENQKSPFGLAKIIILAICASPILIPVMITVVALLFAVLVTFGALVFSLLVTLLALGVAAIVSVIGGIVVLSQSFLGGLFYIMIGLAVVGALMLLRPMVFALIKWLKRCLVAIIKWIGKKTVGRRGVRHEA
jgi:uncharacterized membrane protein